jgi:glycerate kinase
VLIAPDKFKGTLTSQQAAMAIERGLKRAWPDVQTTRLALTDGGEGFVEFMVRHTGGRFRTSRTVDAAGRPIRARWGVLGNGRTAVVGLNEASGLAHLPAALRNPERTTNAGTGRILRRAVAEGCTEVVLGLGGSATTEAGISLAMEFGYVFTPGENESPVLGNGANLGRIRRVRAPAGKLSARFVVATDVDNPLYGPRGAAHQFGPQKGADAAMVRRLDAGLRNAARIVKRDLGVDCADEPGAGAAGGCGYGLMAFFQARRENGFQMVRRLIGLDTMIRRHDLVITGEGCLDRTSLLGKAPQQLGALASQLKRPVWALCGRVTLPAARTPFDVVAGLSTPRNPGPRPDTLTCAQHARRLEELAYRTAVASAKRAQATPHI